VTTNNHRESSAAIDEAAATWATRLDAEALTPDETRILETWLAGDPRRRGALARAMAILAHPGRGFCG
jgi:transmembrane sensor